MTADADAPSRGARWRAQGGGRSPFELLALTATPVPGALVVVEIEGRVATASGRFARRPVLVVEPAEGRPRLELAPARSTLDGDRWQAAYAIPAEAYDAARFALGLRGTLLDLPAPDEPTAADRQTLLAREANVLRRQLEAAEAATESARADAVAAAGELGAAVSAARDGALAESAARIAELEAEVTEAHRRATADAAELRAGHEDELAARDRALAEATTRHEEALAAKDRALDEATARHGEELAARDRALDEATARHGEELAARDRTLDEATSRHEEALAAKDRALEDATARHDAARADEARARDADEGQEQEQHRSVTEAQARALAAEEGIGVLREELAEERQRSQARIAELEQELVAVTGRLEALRRAAEAEPRTPTEPRSPGLWSDAGPGAAADADETRVLHRPERDDDPDRTQVHSAPAPVDEDDDTRPFTAGEEREAAGETVLPLERGALPRQRGGRGVGPWVAVAALVAFVVVLLALLGFLS